MDKLEALSSDLEALFLDSSSTDLRLVCPGQGDVRVHSNIISARSPVFSSMMNIDMKEKDSRVITIEDFNIDIVKEMVHFIYTGKLNEAFEDNQNLLVIGNKYQIKSLVAACGEKIAAKISKENVIEMGVFAENHLAKNLLDKCAKFISKDLAILDKNWQDEVKSSPLFVTEILTFLKSPVGLNVWRYLNIIKGQWDCHGSRSDAIGFQTNMAAKLVNIGLFGNTTSECIPVIIEVTRDTVKIFYSSTNYFSNGSTVPIQVPVNVDIEPEKKYVISVLISATTHGTFYGRYGQQEVKCSGGLEVKFSDGNSRNGTSVNEGQIPTITLKIVKNV